MWAKCQLLITAPACLYGYGRPIDANLWRVSEYSYEMVLCIADSYQTSHYCNTFSSCGLSHWPENRLSEMVGCTILTQTQGDSHPTPFTYSSFQENGPAECGCLCARLEEYDVSFYCFVPPGNCCNNSFHLLPQAITWSHALLRNLHSLETVI